MNDFAYVYTHTHTHTHTADVVMHGAAFYTQK